MSNWASKDFKAAIINVFKELKATILKEEVGGIMLIFYQKKRFINKEKETITKN